MKRVFVLAAVLLAFLSACGSKEPMVVAGDPEETEVSYFQIDEPLSVVTKLEADKITCVPLEKDGTVYGFEMRFRKTADVDTLLKSEENFYFARLESGKKQLAVPMEEIRILPDITTNELVLTLLIPQGETVSGGKWTVSFYVSGREDGANTALLAAQKDVTIS